MISAPFPLTKSVSYFSGVVAHIRLADELEEKLQEFMHGTHTICKFVLKVFQQCPGLLCTMLQHVHAR